MLILVGKILVLIKEKLSLLVCSGFSLTSFSYLGENTSPANLTNTQFGGSCSMSQIGCTSVETNVRDGDSFPLYCALRPFPSVGRRGDQSPIA